MSQPPSHALIFRWGTFQFRIVGRVLMLIWAAVLASLAGVTARSHCSLGMSCAVAPSTFRNRRIVNTTRAAHPGAGMFSSRA
jgi:hypothetical protein